MFSTIKNKSRFLHSNEWNKVVFNKNNTNYHWNRKILLDLPLLLHSLQAIILSVGPLFPCTWQTEHTPPWSRLFVEVLESGLESSVSLASCFSIVDLFNDPAGLPRFFGMWVSEGSKTFFALWKFWWVNQCEKFVGNMMIMWRELWDGKLYKIRLTREENVLL